MLDIGFSEMALVAVVALVVVGPKDLPRLMRTVGQWMGRARAMSRHLRSGFDTMMREAEIDELNRQWQRENASIIAATRGASYPDPFAEPAAALPPPADATAPDGATDAEPARPATVAAPGA